MNNVTEIKIGKRTIKKPQLLNFALLIAGTVVFTTVLYVATKGWPGARPRPRTAGQVSQMAFPAQPAPQNPARNPQYQAQGMAQARFISGGQFICPKCGATSLPHFDGQGNPHCPMCGNIMNINRIGTNPAALACPPGGCIRANPAALACPPGGCLRTVP